MQAPKRDASSHWNVVDSAALPLTAGRWGAALLALTGDAAEVARQLADTVNEATERAGRDAHLLAAARTAPGDLAYVTMNRSSLSLELHSGLHDHVWPFPATELADGRLATIEFEGKSATTLVGAGLPFGPPGEVATQSLKTPAERLPFAKPLVNGDGKVVGQFSPWHIQWLGLEPSVPRSLQALERGEHRKAGWTYRSVAISGDQATATALFRNASGGSLTAVHGPGSHWQYECTDAPARYLTNELVELGDPERRLDLWTTNQASPKGTLIYFPGGPGGAPRNENGYVAQQFIQRGWNVAVVSQSGSVGNGPEVSGRLRREGLAPSVERDGALVARYAASLPPEHRVVLFGSSFGGTVAAATSRHLERPHRLVFVAPWMRYRDPSAWVKDFTGTPLIATPTVDSQERYEAATFGIGRSGLKTTLQKQLDLAYGSPSPYADILAAFASADTVSRSGDLPRSYRERTKVVTVGGAHGFSETQGGLWAELRAWVLLEDRDDSPRR